MGRKISDSFPKIIDNFKHYRQFQKFSDEVKKVLIIPYRKLQFIWYIKLVLSHKNKIHRSLSVKK